MHVWVQSKYRVFAESLVTLLTRLGFEASLERTSETELLLCDMTRLSPPYPPPSDLPTVALIEGESADAVALLQQRYSGYIKAEDGSSVLIKALEAARRGEIWAERHVLSQTLARFMTPQLTAREKETLRLLAKGLSNRAIAEQLGVAEGTVKMHVSHLFNKMGMKSRAEIIAHFLNNKNTPGPVDGVKPSQL